MAFKKPKEKTQYFKSVLIAYSILVFHVFMIALLLFLVIFFNGLVQYMIWIFLGGSAAIIFSGYHFYKRMKAQGRTLKEMLRSPLLGDRTVEVSFLGGVATFKISGTGGVQALDGQSVKQTKQLEDPTTIRVRELTDLVRLLENGMITLEEYNNIKGQIFNS
ncbi:hypothetical protein ACFL03_07300 [Thermodesulfobacteriota bacterium]